MKKKVIPFIAIVLIIIQFFPISKDNPAIDLSSTFSAQAEISDAELALLKSACYDCHSHETTFPSYTRVQPVGWWTRGHVRGGRMKVNYSEWASYDKNQLMSSKKGECP